MNAQAGVNPEGRALDISGQVSMALHIATPGVFGVLRVPVRAGRDFTERDQVGMPLAMIINEAAAKLAWPNEKAVGKRIALLRDSAGAPIWWEVVGVVADFRESGLAKEPGPQLYLPLAQTPPIILDAIQRTMSIVARVRGEPLGLTKPIRQAVAQVDAGLPVFAVGAMETRVADSLASARFNTVLLSALGVIGLMLATVGIFGVISFFVSQRAQEIGVRMALGATPGNVLVLVVEQGLRPVVLGVVLGVAASVALTRLLQSLLYGVSATDPLTLTAVAVGVTAVACGAALLPARRATRIDPLAALRD
jgi:predicted permease